MFAKQNILTWAAAILIPLLYMAFYTPYGMDTTDFGYFYGYPWRILNGQVPYRDFSYIKPPFSLYWHAFWLWITPARWEVLGGKAGFLATMLASSWLGSLYLARLFDFKKLRLSLPLLATSGFVFGVHSFPHMPWHTPDGVLFCSAALWLGASGWPVLSGILAACAMLCKQSFMLIPAAILAMIWLWRGGKRESLRFLLGWLGSMACAWLWLYANDAWIQFRNMTTGQLDIREALDAGLFIYFRQNWLIPLLGAMPWLIWKIRKKTLPPYLQPAYCYLAVLTGWYVTEALRQQTWIGYGMSWPTFFMLLGGVCILRPGVFLLPSSKYSPGKYPRLAASVGLGAALLSAWSVAISGGYKIPAFFAAPLLFSFYLCHAKFGGNANRLAWAALLAGIIMFGVGYQYPYTFPVRPLRHSEQIYNAGKVYPVASGVYVDPDMLARLEELKELRAKYGPCYKTLPGFSMAYYLNGDKPVYGSDWLIDWEINGEVDRLYQELLDKKITVFMERDQLDAARADAYDRAGYTVPQRVRKLWKIVEETPHFVVFQPPDAASDEKF